MGKKPEKLWTGSFLLLWQGQLVSIIGDVVYAVALGFWILEKTGSTALMGGLMAASALPRIVVSPFAGVIVDRTDRRRLLIWMDVVRGLAVAGVAAAGFAGFLQVWMVFAAGVLLGICGAFFSPAANSVIPDIVGKTKIVPANSMFSMIQTGGNVVGNPLGGALYQVIGAPFLFLINGLSYLFSAGNLLFAKVPRIRHESAQVHFLADLKSGFSFVWHFRGLRNLVAVAAIVNFLASMAIMLFLPYFKESPDLGPARYGIAMAFFTRRLPCWPWPALPTRCSTSSSWPPCSSPCPRICGERSSPSWACSRRGSRPSRSPWAGCWPFSYRCSTSSPAASC
jgi:DHA3 family macrolide efflux protein-like MFS transporter